MNSDPRQADEAGGELVRLPHGRYMDGFWVDPAYHRLGCDGALPEVWLSGLILARLQVVVRNSLARGFGILVWDGWRPLALQRVLFRTYGDALVRKRLQRSPREDVEARLTDFVTDPDRTSSPPAHSTGGAVDLTLCDPSTGEAVDMGGEFDELSSRSHPSYYDGCAGHAGREFARLRNELHEFMLNAGFARLETEWWHFEYGTALWSERTGEPAFLERAIEGTSRG